MTGLFLNINTETILKTDLLWHTKYGLISPSLIFHLRKWTKTSKRIPIVKERVSYCLVTTSPSLTDFTCKTNRENKWGPQRSVERFECSELAEYLDSFSLCLLFLFSLLNNLWFKPQLVIWKTLGPIAQSPILQMNILKCNHPLKFSRAASPILTLLPRFLEWKTFWLTFLACLRTCLAYNRYSRNIYWLHAEWIAWVNREGINDRCLSRALKHLGILISTRHYKTIQRTL